MCGIAGIFEFKGKHPNLDNLQKMLKVLKPRGPDDTGTWHTGPIAFGHRRLSIIDLSNNAHQPMVDEAASLVFNGTIYNYKELKIELIKLGFSFQSTSDTEVILKAYQAWGENCVTRFNGMFAFCLWDKKRQQLFMARDRFGIKPLYYSLQAGRLLFASNPQALLKGGGVDTLLDEKALHFHFSLHAVVPAPRTILSGVRKLPPAHSLTIKTDGSYSSQRYWQLDSLTDDSLSARDWIVGIQDQLQEAVNRRIQAADVPVGVLLSGGLDSSLLTALLVKSGASKLQTFSIGFEDTLEEKGHEFDYSDQVVQMYQTEHHKLKIPNHDVLQRLPDAISNMAEPMFGQDAIAFYLLSERVSKHVKVVQSGQGADEVFGGYFWYQQMNKPVSNNDWQTFHDLYVDRDHNEMREMLGSNFVEDTTSLWLKDKFISIDASTMLDKVLNLDVTNLIVDDPVKRVDNMTMAWGLEARVPFLDHELVEFAAKMPASLKIKDGGKWALKEIARGILPDAVIDRPKGYFPMPALKYVRGDFLGWMRKVLLSDVARNRGLYQTEYLEKLLTQPTKHFTKIKGSKLWQLALTESWLQNNNIS